MRVLQQDQLAVKYLSPEDTRVAASLLYQAYHDDPILRAMLMAKKEQDYEAKLRALIREELVSFGQGQQPIVGLFEGSNLVATACVFEAQSNLQASRYWHWRLRLMMSAGYLQTQQLIEKEDTIRLALSEYGHYYFLAFIAVDPHIQGQGLGHYLLAGLDDLVATNDAASGMAVFVTKIEQKAFFVSHGYQSVKTLCFNKVNGELMFKKKITDITEE
ncbi:N-acetyltransferase [Pseudoalteromonas citrea]|uniref:N-acetyltransferase n=1 Tax=Pseudoalteromonas citrea TaxID=43655 RepID=A0A5S3XT25_9GAMM|nr:GNAT family N-acetyltransferase [Pseudoalteromonas citrea]TMP46113.1 N-acetyltransferase [Pseudoalteromonas citrea]TMP60948.1 N-acetyltransferase [Pseudoalteromonas citrea]